MYNYRKGLAEMPSYDVVERPWNIKVNANECGMNLPPLVEDRVMARMSHIAFNRYPNEEMEDLMEAIAKNYGMSKENVLLGNGSSEIIEKIFHCFPRFITNQGISKGYCDTTTELPSCFYKFLVAFSRQCNPVRCIIRNYTR